MNVRAKSKYVRVSPFKLRPFANVVRGYTVDRALAWLKTRSLQRLKPLEKVIFSAFSNAKNMQENVAMNDLIVRELRIDQGPTYTYYKPRAMGRAQVQKKRLCHIEVVLGKRVKQ